MLRCVAASSARGDGVERATTTAAVAVTDDGRLIQNGAGDGVATAGTGARQRSVDTPSE